MSVSDLIIDYREDVIPLDKIQFSAENKSALNQLLKEYKYIRVLKDFKLPVDNKLLLFGHTGCGKTTTARAIADYLGKRIVILNLSKAVSSKLGETSKNIEAVFRKAKMQNAVLFLDEFDYIGRERDYDVKDSSEMKRLVNTIIQLIDTLPETALLIAATNHSKNIDTALLRRFQLRLKYELPKKEELDTYYNNMLDEYPKEYTSIDRVYDISFAEAKDIIFRAVKHNIIKAEELKSSN